MHLGYLQLRNTIEEWRERGLNNVRLAPAPEAMKPPPVPTDDPAYAGLVRAAGSAPIPTGPKAEEGAAGETNLAVNGGGSNGIPNGDASRSVSGSGAKRYSDLPDGADGNREREKRRRYD